MSVALQDLGRARRRLEAQTLARDPLDLGVDRRVLADRARELAHPQAVERMLDPQAVPVECERPAGELQPERRGLRMHTMRAAHAERFPMCLRLVDDDVERALDALEHERARFLDCEREGGVDYVRGGETEMEPTPVLTEFVRDRVDERRDIVVRLAFELGNSLRGRRFAAAAMRSTASAGRTPMADQPASAASSTSSIRASLASSDQIRAMAGRE